ncbi:hypothetical protein ACRRTK_015625 [Alexandromys fortis]
MYEEKLILKPPKGEEILKAKPFSRKRSSGLFVSGPLPSGCCTWLQLGLSGIMKVAASQWLGIRELAASQWLGIRELAAPQWLGI